MSELLPKDPKYATEVYPLPYSNPKGKIVIRKGKDVVVIWPGDLTKVINALTDLEWKQTVETGEVLVDA